MASCHSNSYRQSSTHAESRDIYTDHQGTDDQYPDDQCGPVSATCQCPSMSHASAHQCHISVPTSAHQCHVSVPFAHNYQC
ncbi:unnamed protein product [Staurois parvus]|uniref:Epidermal differentiation protein n=1 Tax=Staurois parvus TaxID=386267 RepID=A0ABN9AEW5_9NEOB|nr:unnamed protein product [Staurois parvus]